MQPVNAHTPKVFQRPTGWALSARDRAQRDRAQRDRAATPRGASIWSHLPSPMAAQWLWDRLALSILACAIGYSLILNGDAARVARFFDQLVTRTAADAGFAIATVRVEGAQRVTHAEVRTALALNHDAVMIGFDAAAAEARLMQVPWVERAVVRRHLPDTLIVHLTERQPMARIALADGEAVMDFNANVIAGAQPQDFSHLPLVTGKAAIGQVRALFEDLAARPHRLASLQSAHWVAGRRWTLERRDGVIVHLPATGTAAALERLDAHNLPALALANGRRIIDLRVGDRVTLMGEDQRPEADAAGDGASAR